MRALIAACVVTLCAPTAPRAAVPVSPAPRSSVDVISSLERLPHYDQALISPDGSRVAWVVGIMGSEGSVPGRSRIRIAEIASGRTITVTAAKAGRTAREGDLAWSPDGKRLVFVSDAAKAGQPQLYLAEVTSDRVRRLTSVSGDLASPAFSPDGRRLAFLLTAGARVAAAMDAGPREIGLVEATWPVARIAVMDAAGGPVRSVSPPDLFVYDLDWSPDGKSLAATAARGPGVASWWVARLITVAVATGETRTLAAPTTQLARPRWSPDGRAVAVLGGLMSDQGMDGGDVWLVPADGGAARNLTEGRSSTASSFAWTGPDRLVVAEWDGGGCAIAALRPSDRQVERLWRGDEHIGTSIFHVAVSLSRDGTASAVVRASFDQAPRVEVGPIGAWKPVEKAPGPLGLIGRVTSLTWTTDVGEVQGWLLAPPAVEPGRRYPMVVSVHGGPSFAATPSSSFTVPVLLASQGYFVLLPNPRGSFGRGQTFIRANVRDFGGGDLRDILAGVDAALAAAPVDAGRLGIYGWSYGGFMAMWGITQTGRFGAAVAGAGMSNWLSYYGTNQIDTWMLPFFGASPYDDPEAYRRCSAIEQVKKVRTPTLFLHGERDAEVPVTQSREMWKALRTLGVPTELVVFADEGHVPRASAYRRERLARTLAWFDRWLAAPATVVPR
jgi:dipeptidyl aminopeptidase/acylaminoacyl peptidase